MNSLDVLYVSVTVHVCMNHLLWKSNHIGKTGNKLSIYLVQQVSTSFS